MESNHLNQSVSVLASLSFLACVVLEVYGLSEYGVVSCTLPGASYSTGVGPPVPFCQLKLVDAEFGYKEICVKGPSQFLGYLGEPVANITRIDEQGWLMTGIYPT